MRLNDQITALKVRLIDEHGAQAGIVMLRAALDTAKMAGLDLVEISPNADPPVCKIMNYGKHLFQLNKKQTVEKKKQKRIQVKMLRIRPGIEEGDYQVKLRNLIRFLQDGDKVEISLRFRGRELAHKELGMKILLRLKSDLADYGDPEREPVFEGKQMQMIVAPKKVKIKN